jgi:hypothetical protein
MRVSKVMVLNGGTMGDPYLRWGPQIRSDDGRSDVCIVHMRTALDYPKVVWNMLLGRQERDPTVR